MREKTHAAEETDIEKARSHILMAVDVHTSIQQQQNTPRHEATG